MLDAWAVLAVLKGEPGATQVRDAIAEGEATISSVNLGEALYILTRVVGEDRAAPLIERMRLALRTEDPDWPMVVAAARVKAQHRVSYADAFAVATAEHHRVPLLTGDPEIVALERELHVVDLR